VCRGRCNPVGLPSPDQLRLGSIDEEVAASPLSSGHGGGGSGDLACRHALQRWLTFPGICSIIVKESHMFPRGRAQRRHCGTFRECSSREGQEGFNLGRPGRGAGGLCIANGWTETVECKSRMTGA
jgi:hypothetical protein